MIDLADKLKRGRLIKAIKNSREALEPFRKVRTELVQDYMGSWYNRNNPRPKTLVNLMNQTARIYCVALASNNPQALVSTPVPEALAFSRRFEVNLNKLISDMNLGETFRDILLDAFFCIGCGVVMMQDTDMRFHGLTEAEEDVWLDPGEPFFNRVSVDDLILDMSAKELTKMRFCGHRYRADYEKIMAEPGYDNAVKSKLKATKRDQGDQVAATRDVASGDACDDDLKDMIWLQDVWIAENRTIVTMACDQDLPPLIEREWKGSQAGPYKFLSLGDTPDSVIPTSPAMNLKDLHDLQNRLHVRMEEDSDAHRVVNAYAPGGADDAEKVRKGDRNSWIRMNNPEAINQVEVGGVDQRDLGLATFITGTYDRMAGNLQAMGGLGAQASTVGQEELIHGQLSKNVADMRMAVVSFASKVILDLGRLMWEDEELELKTSVPVGNSGISVSSDWPKRSQRRDGEFEDYGFRVEEYSMVFKTPQQHLQEYFQVMERLMPMWPMMEASGVQFDAEAYIDQIARLMNKPELKKFITFAPPVQEPSADQHGASQAANTTRTNIRKNIPTGGTAEARQSAEIQALMGGKSQSNGQTQAAMARPPA